MLCIVKLYRLIIIAYIWETTVSFIRNDFLLEEKVATFISWTILIFIYATAVGQATFWELLNQRPETEMPLKSDFSYLTNI